MLSAWLYGTSVHHFVAVAIALAYVLSVAPSRLSLRGPLVLASTIAIRKSKTQAGQRMIPLNDDALGAIRALYSCASANLIEWDLDRGELDTAGTRRP
jgi:hypothetical protein